MKAIKVLIADDHQLVIEGIKSLLDDVATVFIIGEAVNGKDCLEKLGRMDANVVLMDMDMPIMNGIDATRVITTTYPDIKVIALSMYNEKALITKMLEVGAKGYLLKNVSKDELECAITTVYEGDEYFSTEIPFTLSRPTAMGSHSAGQRNEIDQLTPREVEVLALIAQGLSNNEIGEKLFISARTVDTHRTNLMKKLKIRNIAGLIRCAIQNGLIE